jgi:tRNA(Ile)-lysidine synthase
MELDINNILFNFRQFLKEECGCNENEFFLLAVSGGIDSMVMLDLFHREKLNYALLHCNFQLRGVESDGDEEFIRSVAKQKGVNLYVKRFDTKKYAEKQGISIQMAARDLRYNWFHKEISRLNAGAVATAHHKDDAVETFFINLSRGTGISGLTGINSRTGNIIRPILFLSRREISLYAQVENIKWREDSSNPSVKYLRNKIRHLIISQANLVIPGFSDAVFRTITQLKSTKYLLEKAASDFIKRALRTKGDTTEIAIDEIKKASPADIILFEVLQKYGFNYETTCQLIRALDGQPGKRFLSDSYEITVDRSLIIIQPLQHMSEKAFVIPEGTTIVEFPVHLVFSMINYNENHFIPKDNHIASFDMSKLQFPLIIRNWKKGDYFYPFGMKGRKKLSDFFTDHKIPVSDKKKKWILESGGDIIWIIGMRTDERYKVTPLTQKILQINYHAEIND